MTNWHAEITLDTKLNGTAREDLTATLPGYAVVTADKEAGRATVALTVDASTLRQATDTALKAVTDAARAMPGKASITGIRVLTEEAYRAEIERPPTMDLVGSTEGGEILRVSRQRFEELARKHPDFPPHVAELARGRLYTKGSILAFDERWDRKPTGRPPKVHADS